jgi:hypothetical protein
VSTSVGAPPSQSATRICFFPHLVEYRAEVFNLFNHVNFANPISDFNAIPSSGGSINPNTGQLISPGAFGRIISTSNNPRIIQFALKLSF